MAVKQVSVITYFILTINTCSLDILFFFQEFNKIFKNKKTKKENYVRYDLSLLCLYLALLTLINASHNTHNHSKSINVSSSIILQISQEKSQMNQS